MREFLFIFILCLIQLVNGDILIRDQDTGDIEDVVLDLNPNVVLNLDTPEDSLIGTVIVLTYSRKKYNTIYISPDDPFFYLKDENVFLKKSGFEVLQTIDSIFLPITVTDFNQPQGVFKKYVRIPVEHIKEDSVIKIDSIVDEICDKDLARRLFSISIIDPTYNPNEPYNCRISYTNYPSVEFVINKLNATEFEVYLPPNVKDSLFNQTAKPNMDIQLVCSANNLVTHKRNVTLKICRKITKLKDIVYEDKLNNRFDPVIQFDTSVNTPIAKLKVIDTTSTSNPDNYEFSLAKFNEYIDVTPDGTILLKNKLDKNLLKYVDPKIIARVLVSDKRIDGREIIKRFTLLINDTNQEKPSLRYKADNNIFAPFPQFAQEAELFIKIGSFELNQTQFPPDRFDLRIKNGNFSLDDQGNLFISENPLKLINDNNNDALVTLNLFDKKENINILEENFSIELPLIDELIPTVVTTTRPTSLTTKSNQFPFECTTDKDCNKNGNNGPNVCIKISSLKDRNIDSYTEAENLIRKLEFITNKDKLVFLKYNQILNLIASPTKEFNDFLIENKLTIKDLYDIGICVCEHESQGFRCQTPIANDRPHQCYRNSPLPACNPLTSICQPSEFLLRNNLQRPAEKLFEYKSFYCECTKDGIIGVNCEYQKSQCLANNLRYSNSRLRRQLEPTIISDPIRRYPVSFIGSVDSNKGKCSNNDEFCYPTVNSSNVCLDTNKTEPIVNYLIFDESNKNPNFREDPSKPSDRYKRLNLSDASVIMGLQDFIKDEVIPRYINNDYSKIPKGPIAIMRPSIDMSDTLNNVRDRVNSILSQNDSKAFDMLDRLTANKVQQQIQDTILYLSANKKLNNTLPTDLKETIDKLVDRLNLSDMKNFSTPLWTLGQNELPLQLDVSLAALKANSDKLNKPDSLPDVLTLTAPNEPYLDLFDFSNKPYSLIKLDILPGIYLEPDGDLTVRPTPGIFFESLPKDTTSPNRELFFLPGIFNPATTKNCDVKSIFVPGIMSLPIDSYNLANLPEDSTKYLNKFVPMQIPFNLNGFLTPLKTSTADTIASLLNDQENKLIARSHLLLTPTDFNPDSAFDIITKNEKFMSNLFSNESLYKVVREQTQLDKLNLASTQLLSNPTMLPASKQDSFSIKCISNDTSLFSEYSPPRGAQFYKQTNPADNVTVVPFILYDANGKPLPASVVRSAIDKYCANYQARVNEFHARICDAQAQTTMLKEAQKTNPEICAKPTCSFLEYVNDYYNPKPPDKKNKRNLLPILILASILGLLWLLWLASLLCLCCPCCPLAAFLKRRKLKNKVQPFVITNKSNKMQGDTLNRRFDIKQTQCASGELVRSIPSVNEPSLYSVNNRDVFFAKTAPISTFTITSPPPLYTQTNRHQNNKNNTHSSVFVKSPANKLTTIFSSSLINTGGQIANNSINQYEIVRPPSTRHIENAAEKVFPTNDVMDTLSGRTFKAKRIARLDSSSIRRRWSVSVPTKEFDDINNIYNLITINKSSLSYPRLDNENFYRTNTFQPERLESFNNQNRFNLTTHIIEQVPILTNKDSCIKSLIRIPRKVESPFHLKRLSNQIITPSPPPPLPASASINNQLTTTTYKKLDKNLDNDFDFYYTTTTATNSNDYNYFNKNMIEPTMGVFKLQRLEEKIKYEHRPAATTTAAPPPPIITTHNSLISNRIEHINYLPMGSTNIYDLNTRPNTFESSDKKQNELVIDWLLRKCNDDDEIYEMRPIKTKSNESDTMSRLLNNLGVVWKVIRIENNNNNNNLLSSSLSSNPKIVQLKINDDRQTKHRPSADEIAAIESLFSSSDSSNKSLNKLFRWCSFCNQQLSESDLATTDLTTNLAATTGAAGAAAANDLNNDDDLIYICDKCHNSWQQQSVAAAVADINVNGSSSSLRNTEPYSTIEDLLAFNNNVDLATDNNFNNLFASPKYFIIRQKNSNQFESVSDLRNEFSKPSKV